ncbi:MAG: hypothetical protein RIB45_01500 [Marivibrio sp.]|uniref:flagellar biosynthesis protein FlhF n=1 Tax=Marivibrio sp. TaxID=2039719 RepID=UPI0032ECEBE5
MRLKSFHADSLSAALKLVRETLGDDAIIVATEEADDEMERGARVTAAIEEREDEAGGWDGGDQDDALERITTVLERHGTPRALTDEIVQAAADSEELDVTLALAAGLDRLFAFRPVPDAPGGRPLMLIGPPGVGKTVTCAKIAARLALAYEERGEAAPVVLIGADPMRVGAVDQLKAYAERLGARFEAAEDADGLKRILQACGRGELIVIDTPGANPFDLEELAYLIELAAAADLAPVLLLGAGRDAEEAADLAKAFRPVEPTRLIATGLDIAHRLGALLAAADAGRLAFADVSRSPRIADGLKPLNPLTLARLLLPDAPAAESAATTDEDAGQRAPENEDERLSDRTHGLERSPRPPDDFPEDLPDGLQAALRAARDESRRGPRFGPADDEDDER